MQTPGTYISGIGHLALIGWLVLGWGFQAEPLVFDEINVSVISGEEFEAMQAVATPIPGEAEPTEMTPPVVEDETPPAPAQEQPADQTPPPEPIAEPQVEAPPPPPPEPLVTDATDTPPTEPTPPAPPPAAPDLDISQRPVPRPVDRVTPEPVAPPPPDTQVSDVDQPEIRPDADTPSQTPQEEQQATAREESADQIVTEAEEPSGAVATSIRPQARPNRPAPPAEPEPETQTAAAEPEPVPQADAADVNAALAAALAGSESAPAANLPLGQGLTESERGSFFNAIGGRWNVDVGAESASIIVTVTFSIGPDRTIEGDVSLESATEGSPAAQEAAFQNARRAIWAISRSGGFPLPDDKYESWKNVRITFDPTNMRLR